MSFVDQLRQNYDAGDEKEAKVRQIIEQVVAVTKTSCSRVSKSERRVHGYLCIGYDEPEIAEDGRIERFVYDTDFGPHKKSILAFAPGAERSTYDRQAPARIVRGIKQKLEAEGFVNPVVRTEETTQQFKYGHTEFLHREKYDEFPAFAIYVDVKW